MTYKQYTLLNEALIGSSPLGVKHKQNLGLVSNMPGIAEVGEGPAGNLGGSFGGEGPDMGADEDPFKKKKPFGDDDDDMDDMDDDDMDGDDDEGSLEDRIADLEAEIASLKAKLGHDDEDLDGDKEGLDMGADGDENGGMDKGNLPVPSGPPAMMKKGMKKESMHVQDECGEEEGELVGKGKGGPTFMMKKGMKSGKCGCKKCKANMKKESSYYDRPKNYDASEKAFWKSLGQQLSAAEVNQKFDDGLRNFQKEDILLPPTDNLEVPAYRNPGEVGYAPQTRIGEPETQAESVGILLKKIDDLEKQIKG